MRKAMSGDETSDVPTVAARSDADIIGALSQIIRLKSLISLSEGFGHTLVYLHQKQLT